MLWKTLIYRAESAAFMIYSNAQRAEREAIESLSCLAGWTLLYPSDELPLLVYPRREYYNC